MMQKPPILTGLAAALLLAGSALAQPSAGNATAEARLLEQLKRTYPSTTFSSAQPSAIPGVYEVVMGQNIAYVDGSGRYFLIGRMFDMQTKTDITSETRDRIAPRVEWERLPLVDAIKFGSGEAKLAVFSDPDCPFCRQLEAELEKLEGVTVYVFPYPIASLHPGATRAAQAIWCAPDKAKAWRDYVLRKVAPPPAPKDCAVDAITRNVALASRYGIAATPTLVSVDGRLAPGAVKVDQIKTWLARVK